MKTANAVITEILKDKAPELTENNIESIATQICTTFGLDNVRLLDLTKIGEL